MNLWPVTPNHVFIPVGLVETEPRGRRGALGLFLSLLGLVRRGVVGVSRADSGCTDAGGRGGLIGVVVQHFVVTRDLDERRASLLRVINRSV